MEPTYGQKTVPQLQSLLRERGLRAYGRKVDLIQRLTAWDKMSDSQRNVSLQSSIPPAAKEPPWPEASSFRCLSATMQHTLPPMTKQHFEEYVIYRQACDKVPNNDLNAMVKGNLLSKDKVQGMSLCQKDGIHFFVGTVEAMMKKRVLYTIKGGLDSNGEVCFSACDCPAGSGPHATCKHIVAGDGIFFKETFWVAHNGYAFVL